MDFSGDITTGIQLTGTISVVNEDFGDIVIGSNISGQIVGGPQGDKGDKGDKGDTGDEGPQGPQGPTGATGVGVPTGGLIGQILTKVSNGDYDTYWANQSYSEFVFNSSGIQKGNRYNNWSDLHNALQNQDGAKRIYIEQNETLDDTGMPTAGWNLDNVAFIGTAPGALGGPYLAFDGGFKVSSWVNGGLHVLLVYINTNNPIYTMSGGVHLFTAGGATINALTGKGSLFKTDSGAIFVWSASSGAVIGSDNTGYNDAVIESNGTMTVLALVGQDCELKNTAIEGSSMYNIIAQDSSIVVSSLTNPYPNVSGMIIRQLGAKAELVAYDNTGSGLTSQQVGPAITELAGKTATAQTTANSAATLADSKMRLTGTWSAGSGGITFFGGGTDNIATYTAKNGEMLLTRTTGSYNLGNGTQTFTAGEYIIFNGLGGGGFGIANNTWSKVSPAGAEVIVYHGSNASTPRPLTSNPVMWVGTVEPTNATNHDMWMDES